MFQNIPYNHFYVQIFYIVTRRTGVVANHFRKGDIQHFETFDANWRSITPIVMFQKYRSKNPHNGCFVLFESVVEIAAVFEIDCV